MRTRHLTSPLIGLLAVAALGSSAYAGASDPAPAPMPAVQPAVQPAAPVETAVLAPEEVAPEGVAPEEVAGEISEEAQVELAPGEDPADWGLE